MEKKLVSCRITVREWLPKCRKPVVLCQYNTYGAVIDTRTLVTAEHRTFHAGRKAGFGSSTTIIERINGMLCKVTADRIEDVA